MTPLLIPNLVDVVGVRTVVSIAFMDRGNRFQESLRYTSIVVFTNTQSLRFR